MHNRHRGVCRLRGVFGSWSCISGRGRFSAEFFEATKRFPKEEAFSLTDQIRRSSRSIGAQIAEAWAKRDSVRHFASKLTDADGEQMETQHWLITAVEDGYLAPEIGRPLFELCLEVGRMLGRMKDRAADFCPSDDSSVLREEPAEFFTEATGFPD
jgi:four helix bundle protein